MQLLPTSTLDSYQLPSSQPLLYYFYESKTTFIYHEDTKHYYLFRQNATVLEDGVLPDDTTMVYPMPPCGIVLVTSENSVYLYNFTSKTSSTDDTSGHISKKPKVNHGSSSHYQKLFQANGSLDWVQHVAATLYASSVASQCIHIYDFSSAKHETTPIPQQLVKSVPSCFSKIDFGSNEMSDLDPIFADHFGINSLHGVLMGFANGSICFIPDRDMAKGTIVAAQLQLETIMGLHSCQLTDETNRGSHPIGKNLLIFVGSKGTIQVYSKYTQQQSHPIIYFKEFTLPSMIISISFVKDSPSALVFCKTGLMYQVEFSQPATSNQGATPDIVMKLTQLQAAEDILLVQAIKMHDNTLTYQVITKNGNFSTCEVDLGSSPITITRTAEALKKAINNTLTELSEVESSQIEMDAYHEDINRQLVTLNRTLYTLQNASLKKRRHHNPGDFHLDIVPLIRYAPLTGKPQAFLQTRIRTKLGLNWADWHLNVDISAQRTTKQESDAYTLDKADFMFGKTFLLPLDGFEHQHDDTGIIQTWERELELDQINCSFPLDIYVSLSMNMDTNSDITRDSQEPECLPISNNASNCCTSFLVTFMVVDHLHFSIPLPDSRKNQLKQNGLKDVTTQLHQVWKLPTLSKNGMNIKELQHKSLNYDTSNIRLRFVAPANVDELYRSVLSTLLSEGKSSDEVMRLVDDAEHAYLSIASDPMFPVTITLSKVCLEPAQDLYLNIQLCSLSAHVLMKVEVSLLSRLQPFVSDDDGYDVGATLDVNGSSAYHQRYQQLENQLESLEKCYQQNTDEECDIWQKLNAAWDTTRHLQNDTWLSIHDFNTTPTS